ncbi:MAG: periplasmic heavy metal sensor [Stappiaceae bacterium]
MKSWRTIVILLFLSLAGNAFFIGYGISQHEFSRSDKKRGSMLHAIGARLSKNMEAPYKQQVMDGIEQIRPQYRKAITERRQNYGKLRALLAEPDVNRKAVDEVLATLRSQSEELQALIQDQMVTVILALPAEQRANIKTR